MQARDGPEVIRGAPRSLYGDSHSGTRGGVEYEEKGACITIAPEGKCCRQAGCHAEPWAYRIHRLQLKERASRDGRLPSACDGDMLHGHHGDQ
jgi:hypothetical protein